MNESGLYKGNMSRMESFLKQTPQVVRLDRSDPPSSCLGAKSYPLFVLVTCRPIRSTPSGGSFVYPSSIQLSKSKRSPLKERPSLDYMFESVFTLRTCIIEGHLKLRHMKPSDRIDAMCLLCSCKLDVNCVFRTR